MGIFDGISSVARGAQQQAGANVAAKSALALNMNNYAPEFTNYNAQAAGTIASTAAQNSGYAARSSALFDDAATKKGQINLDNAGIGISREANARQMALLGQLQGFSDQRYQGNLGYFGQQIGLTHQALGLDDFTTNQTYGRDSRALNSDATARGAMISAGRKHGLADLVATRDVSLRGNHLGAAKTIAGLNNQIANAGLDYNADKATRFADMGGIGDSNRRLDLDTVNNALMGQAADRNAATQQRVINSQIAANNAAAKASLSSIEAQRNALFRQLFGPKT